MAVIIGSARIDENGKAMGGKAGDQTGKEVSTQNWYLSSKGWRVFRPNSSEVAEKMAVAMQAACDNSNIGYDQADRLTLYYTARDYGFDIKKVKTKCETDCSALVRVCAAYAGVKLPNFTTDIQAKTLLNSGAFTEMKGSKYTDQSAYLKRGDVLVTATRGHTVIVLSNGSKAETTPVQVVEYKLGNRMLRNGSVGDDVVELQKDLIYLGYSCGSWGADGDFGDSTEIAVKKFQKDYSLEVDGVVGQKTVSALNQAIVEKSKPVENPQFVQIEGGNCYVRSLPNVTGEILGVALHGEKLQYRGMIDEETKWLAVTMDHKEGWVSNKYGRLVKN